MKPFLGHTLGTYSSNWTRTLLLAQAPCHLKFLFGKWRPKPKFDMVPSVQWKVAKITPFPWKKLLCISTLLQSVLNIIELKIHSVKIVVVPFLLFQASPQRSLWSACILYLYPSSQHLIYFCPVFSIPWLFNLSSPSTGLSLRANISH